MNGLKEAPESKTYEIMVTIHFLDGDTFIQPFPVDYADRVQCFMDWFRKPKKDKVWAWHVLDTGQIHMFHHEKIMAVDIDGYIEPDGRKSRWYERLIDKLKVFTGRW